MPTLNFTSLGVAAYLLHLDLFHEATRHTLSAVFARFLGICGRADVRPSLCLA